MKEQDVMQNLLISLKHLKAFFNTFSQEASCDEVLQVVDAAYTEISDLQRAAFDLMIQKGWMKLQYQTASAIEKEYTKFENKTCGQ